LKNRLLPTAVLCNWGGTGHIVISPYPADGILSAFVVTFIISLPVGRQVGCGSGLNIKNSSTAASSGRYRSL